VQLFGASSVAELTALGPWDISPERQPDGCLSSEKAQEMIAIAMREGSHFFEWENRRLNGELFMGDVLLTRMQTGEAVYLQATLRDITARVRANAERELLLKRLDEVATHDQLTGAWNRRQFDELLVRELARARRYNQPLSLIMFDIDHFKNVNDTYGHLAGDDVLAALSVYVSANIRDTDTFARWGGEEFILIVPGVDVGGAARQAEKLRALIEHGDFGAVGWITCSFGVTQFRADDTPDDLTRRVDTAMYAAKRGGRNRVECYESSMKVDGAPG
jgi:diguanylate cyclase (GGDEF)-like protein